MRERERGKGRRTDRGRERVWTEERRGGHSKPIFKGSPGSTNCLVTGVLFREMKAIWACSEEIMCVHITHPLIKSRARLCTGQPWDTEGRWGRGRDGFIRSRGGGRGRGGDVYRSQAAEVEGG